jgi:anti-sigma-K factor RskA
MPEPGIHVDVAGYALDALPPDERAEFERHLDHCESCRQELAELVPVARLLPRAAPAVAPPPSLQARIFIAIERDAAEPPAPVARPRPRWLPRLAAVGAVVLALAAVGLAGRRLGEDRRPGTVEVDARLVAPRSGGPSGSVRVTELGIGRSVAIESDDLPELDNRREFYEVWFVGPGDSRRRPNRVSAGTFHPDAAGRTDVRLTAAAVPRDYPVISVTREPRDGDPRRTGPEILRSGRAGATP